MTVTLSAEQMTELFRELNRELARRDVRAEIYLVGGAVMCLVFGTRDSTRDVDALFEPKSVVYECAGIVASAHGIPEDWLNDGAKGFQSVNARFAALDRLPLSNLVLYAAEADYMLAMKAQSCRLGEAFRDKDDIKQLLRILGVRSVAEAKAIILEFYSENAIPQRATYVIEECLEELREEGHLPVTGS